MTKKYSIVAQTKIGKITPQFKDSDLKSGQVTNRKPAIVVGIADARQPGMRTPGQKKAVAKKKK